VRLRPGSVTLASGINNCEIVHNERTSILKNTKTFQDFLSKLKRRQEDIVTKKAPAKTVVNEIAGMVQRLPRDEQELALGFLLTMPGVCDLLAEAAPVGRSLEYYPLRQFDRGPEGFDYGLAGSEGDARTYTQKLEDDRRDLLRKLAAIQSQMMTKDGISKNSVSKYADALTRISGGLSERRQFRAGQRIYEDAAKQYAVDLLSRMVKRISS
jgi:hypothetical protein